MTYVACLRDIYRVNSLNMRQPAPYEIITTSDGSPTLRLYGNDVGESMHSHQGAFQETLYIYGDAIRKQIDQPTLNVLSVGLGLGYNEVLSVTYALKYNRLDSLYTESYESEEFLILEFTDWVQGQPTSLGPVYDQILNLFANHFQLPSRQIHEALKHQLSKKSLRLKKALGLTTQFDKAFNIVLYDAFCSKTSPHLWQPIFLSYLIKSSCASKCVFSTYACKSDLNKVLRENQFNLEKRKGFAGKRESTFAWR